MSYTCLLEGGGGILGGMLLGHTPVCAVEIEPYCRRILLQRQRDGILPRFPIWDDVRTFDGTPWRGRVDVVCGGFPCQDISAAGKGAGLDGERSGLWGEMARVIREVRPRFAFVENSPLLASRGLHRVLGNLAEMGYDARWGVLGTSDAGAGHRRRRIWILASNTNGEGLQGSKRAHCQEGRLTVDQLAASKVFPKRQNDLPQPVLLGSGHGVANLVDRLRAIGNGQVPAGAALAWRILSGGIE